jgi:hypothetical protein
MRTPEGFTRIPYDSRTRQRKDRSPCLTPALALPAARTWCGGENAMNGIFILIEIKSTVHAEPSISLC